jgi:hypothetical protein
MFAWLFAKIVCPSVKFRYTKDTCSYDYVQEIVYYNPHENAMGFLRNLKEVHKCPLNYGLPLWTILHEIGHYHTLDECDDDLETRALCAIIPLDKAKDCDKLQDLYYGIESEWVATEWAIDYAKSHPFICRLFNLVLR